MSFEDIIKIQIKPILWVLANSNYKNWAMKAKLWRELATNVNFYTYRVGQKFFHLSYPNWVPPEQFFAVSSENTDCPKKIV